MVLSKLGPAICQFKDVKKYILKCPMHDYRNTNTQMQDIIIGTIYSALMQYQKFRGPGSMMHVSMIHESMILDPDTCVYDAYIYPDTCDYDAHMYDAFIQSMMLDPDQGC